MEYPLHTLYFYLAEGCNLKCRHCWITPRFEEGKPQYPTLTPEMFQHITEQALPLGLQKVKLTGGEPLLNPHIDEILDYIKEKELQLSVETNGILCTTEIAEKIALCKNPYVSVSIDGSDKNTHEEIRGVEGCFEKSIKGIKNLVSAGLKPQIIMSLMKKNQSHIPSLIKMAETLGCGSVKFNLIQPVARGEKLHQQGETIPVPELISLGKWLHDEIQPHTPLRLFYGDPPAFRPLSRLLGGNPGDCSLCGIMGILGVLADGSYALCGIGETVPELIFGHAEKTPLQQVWNHSPALIQLRQGLPEKLEGICSRCILKNICRGKCIAENYYRTGNLMAPFWFCQEADSLGLFPPSRKIPVCQA